MPWAAVSIMSLREEFVILAGTASNFTDLCRRYGISRKTGYKWLKRWAESGATGLADASRRPHSSPGRTPTEWEERVLTVRRDHPAWGGRKIARYLEQHCEPADQEQVPSPSTVTSILRRHGCLDPQAAEHHRAWKRFEHPVPNALWQMDFKGDFALQASGALRCHPLSVLDDHSRFALGLYACANERGDTVRAHLTEIFRRYGLPDRMTMDNGAPWGDGQGPFTPLTIWLIQLGVGVSHSHPYHPQTQGKDERFHRTLKAEVLRGRVFHNLVQCQTAFDAWRSVYNLERPHQALGDVVPASRYQVSPRPFPEVLPAIEYGPDDQVRRVQDKGQFSFQGRLYHVSKGFHGYPIALRPTLTEGVWQVYFCRQLLRHIDLHEPDDGA